MLRKQRLAAGNIPTPGRQLNQTECLGSIPGMQRNSILMDQHISPATVHRSKLEDRDGAASPVFCCRSSGCLLRLHSELWIPVTFEDCSNHPISGCVEAVLSKGPPGPRMLCVKELLPVCCLRPSASPCPRKQDLLIALSQVFAAVLLGCRSVPQGLCLIKQLPLITSLHQSDDTSNTLLTSACIPPCPRRGRGTQCSPQPWSQWSQEELTEAKQEAGRHSCSVRNTAGFPGRPRVCSFQPVFLGLYDHENHLGAPLNSGPWFCVEESDSASQYHMKPCDHTAWKCKP